MARSIFYFTDSDTVGGAEQALLTLLSHLDRGEWRPTLLHHPFAGIAGLVERAAALDVECVAVPPLPLGLTGAARVPSLARLLHARRPTVFHAHLTWPLAAKWGLAAAAAARPPAVVATVHLFPELELGASARLQQRLLARRVDRYIAVSADVAARLRDAFGLGPAKIEVVRNGVEPPTITGAGASRTVLAVARLVHQKGIDVLIRAAAQVDATVLVAGDGPERPALETAAPDSVRFLGHRTDVPALLADADVFVLPSRYEGTSLALLEAMGAGKAVVASAIGGNDELVRDEVDGLLVPADDPDALAAALRRLLDDPQLRERLGAAAAARVAADFSAAAAAQRVAAVYREVLGD